MRALVYSILLLLTGLAPLGANEIILNTDVSTELTGMGQWGEIDIGADGFRIESAVTQSSGVYTYSYWMTSSSQFALVDPVDYFMFEVGDQTAGLTDIIMGGALVTNASFTGSEPEPLFELADLDMGSMGLSNMYGLKLNPDNTNLDSLYVEFQSYMAPILGNFAAMAEGGSYVYSTGLEGGMGMVWTPDAQATPTPEPATYVLFATMLGIVMLARRNTTTNPQTSPYQE